MSELARKSREAMRDKARRLAHGDPHERVTSATWTPPEPLLADVQTGERPVSRVVPLRKAGGKVYGETHHHAGRKARKSGGRLVDEFTNRDVKEANELRAGTKQDGGFKRGGIPTDGRARAHKLIGGPNVGDLTVPQNRFAFGPAKAGIMLKRGGSAWEGSKEDEREDKKLAKKHHMTREAFEKSELDEKHDKHKSMEGLKKGGKAKKCGGGGTYKRGGKAGEKWIQGAIKHPGALHRELHVPEGEKIPAKKLAKAAHSDNPKLRKQANLAKTLKRMHHASGGRAKGKTDINIVIAPGGAPPSAAAGPLPVPPKPPAGVPVPMGPPPQGAMPIPMPMPGGGMPPAPPPMMPRKRGGRTYRSYEDMDAGALSGEGRLEKTEIQEHKH